MGNRSPEELEKLKAKLKIKRKSRRLNAADVARNAVKKMNAIGLENMDGY